MQLFGFIIRNRHDTRSPEGQTELSLYFHTKSGHLQPKDAVISFLIFF